MTDVDVAETPTGTAPGSRLRPLERARIAWRQLTSMRIALILLFLLAIAAIPGSLFPQRGADPAQVAQYFAAHPGAAPWLDRLGMFDVYSSPWFAAIYLLLFISLVGCVLPRLGAHVTALKTPPPPAPRNLSRLAHATSYDTTRDVDAELTHVASVLKAQRWRAVVRDGAVCAEKGYAREWGNLLFHYSLVFLLIAIAAGSLFGYRGSTVLLEGQTFVNSTVQYVVDSGRAVDVRDITPFSVTMNEFRADYLPDGQPTDFAADVSWRRTPGDSPRTASILPNHPLGVPSSLLGGDTNVYLIGHGYALDVTVRGKNGELLYDNTQLARPVPGDTNLTSTGAVKVPLAGRDQDLGFAAVLAPTYSEGGGSIFPAPNDPRVTLTAYKGNLGENAQTVYELDTSRMKIYSDADGPLTETLAVGETWTLPDGNTVTFNGVIDWVQLSVTHDPGKRAALVAAVLMITGLLISLFIRRRRLWVRPVDAGTGVSVDVGGLSRREGDSFDDEFARLVERLSEPRSKEAQQ